MYALRVMSAYGILTLRYRAPQTGVIALGLAAVAYLLLGEVAEPLRSCWAVLLAAGLMVGARLAWGGWLINRPWVKRALAQARWDTVVVGARRTECFLQTRLERAYDHRQLLDGEQRLLAAFFAAASGQPVRLWYDRFSLPGQPVEGQPRRYRVTLREELPDPQVV